MKKMLFLILLLFPAVVNAETLNDKCTITINNQSYNKLTDESYTTYLNFTKDDIINISCEDDIYNIYIMYNIKSTTGTIEYTDNIDQFGQLAYLNEVIKLKQKAKDINISYDDNYSIAEIYVLSKEIPNWVQDWQSLDKADLMLFSTHADDEQLFFAGLMPTYVDKGYKIQVVYFTNHYNNTNRYHEQLEGLWTIGIRYYPVISTFPDAFSQSLEGATTNLERAGHTLEDALAFQVDQIRKYKPYVVVGHDEKGEYSHGQHILNTHLLKDAILKANDSGYQTSYNYDPWQISKLYLHLYAENPIVLNYDIPLDHYNGMTAYEVSKEGYSKHYSQQYTWFTEWLNGPNNSFTSATQIKTYNPAYYGLYYTTVGEDIEKNDMFENVKFPADEEIKDSINETINTIENNIKEFSLDKKNLLSGIIIISVSIIGLIIIFRKK